MHIKSIPVRFYIQVETFKTNIISLYTKLKINVIHIIE